MDKIDAIRIDFSSDTALIMNLCIAFIMFGVALDMKVADFKRIVEYPKSVAIGLISQLIILPVLTIVLIKLWGVVPSVALGLIMISACPGGNISNFAVHLGKGNTALSVTMTSIITLTAIVITPLSFTWWSKLIPETQSIITQISVGPLDMLEIIVAILLVPLVIGMWLNSSYPKFIEKIKKAVRKISLLMFAAFICFALIANRDNIVKYLHLIFILVVVHNVLALMAGYWFARLNKRSIPDSKAISMETGIQNAGLGLVLIFNFFGDYGGMMIVAAFWGVWNLISAFSLGLYWNYTSKELDEAVVTETN